MSKEQMIIAILLEMLVFGVGVIYSVFSIAQEDKRAWGTNDGHKRED